MTPICQLQGSRPMVLKRLGFSEGLIYTNLSTVGFNLLLWGILSELFPLAQVILGLRGAKLAWGRKKNDKNAHILTVNIAVLPSLSDTMSLSSSAIYSELIIMDGSCIAPTHRPSHQLYARCHNP